METYTETKSGQKPVLKVRATSGFEAGRDFDLIDPILERAVELSYGELSLDYIHHLLLNSMGCAFICFRDELPEATLVIEIIDYPGIRVAVVIAIAGRNIKDYMLHWKGIEEWAQRLGAREMRFQVTPAVERLWRKLKVPMTERYKVMIHDLRSSLQ